MNSLFTKNTIQENSRMMILSNKINVMVAFKGVIIHRAFLLKMPVVNKLAM